MAWNDLSLSDKARMMQLAVRSGITDLRTIEEVYNKYAEGGNLFGEGGPMQESSYGKLNKAWKEAVKKVADKVGVSKDKVEQYYNDGRLMPAIAAWYQLSNNGMIRENDSPTKEASEARAISQNQGLYGNISHRDKLPQSGAPNMDYAVPYLEDKEIKIKNAGRTTTNALDSIAKYAGLAGISLQEGLGLFKQETGLGSTPYGNVQNTSKGKTQEEKDKIRETNRALLNNNYFRQFGWIPAEYMVRDFRYNLDGYEIDRNIPPLLHAFTLFKKGDYNRGDPNHTRDVLNAGELVLQDKGVQDWIKSSKYTKGVKIRK